MIESGGTENAAGAENVSSAAVTAGAAAQAGATASEPQRSRKSRVAARTAAAVAAVAFSVWFFRHPADDEKLLDALPPSSSLVAFVRGIASQEKALLANPVVDEALRAFGEDPDHVREENSGTYWTLFWLTGPRSALSLVEKPGECGGIGWYLAGASAAGWKTKFLELLWRVKYVPFLGKLKTTERGTRYMEFKGHGYLPENGIVLGLDIVDGVLVATLAEDPSLVEELAARVRTGTRENRAPVLGAGNVRGWSGRGIRHRLWIDPAAVGLDSAPFTLDLGSLAGPGLLARAAFDDAEPSGSVPAPNLSDCSAALKEGLAVASEGTFLFVAGSLPSSPALPFFGGVFPPRPGGPAAIWASGAPYAGCISILEAPAVSGMVPIGSENGGADAPFDSTKAAVAAATTGLRPRWRVAGDGTALLHFKSLKTNLFGETPDADCCWMRRSRSGAFLEFGTHFGSATAQREAAASGSTLAGTLDELLSADPLAESVAFVDCAKLSETASQAGALVELARRFGLRMTDAEAGATKTALSVVSALGGLGKVTASTRSVPAAEGLPPKRLVSIIARGPEP